MGQPVLWPKSESPSIRSRSHFFFSFPSSIPHLFILHLPHPTRLTVPPPRTLSAEFIHSAQPTWDSRMQEEVIYTHVNCGDTQIWMLRKFYLRINRGKNTILFILFSLFPTKADSIKMICVVKLCKLTRYLYFICFLHQIFGIGKLELESENIPLHNNVHFLIFFFNSKNWIIFKRKID